MYFTSNYSYVFGFCVSYIDFLVYTHTMICIFLDNHSYMQRRNTFAFTLVELVVVIVILAIL